MNIKRYLYAGRMTYAVLENHIIKKPRILTLQIVLNHNCNQDCLYCCVDREDVQMDFNELVRILDYLKKHGTLQISYVGGEPTLHPDYKEIIKYTKDLGFYITVSTNGTNRLSILNAEEKS